MQGDEDDSFLSRSAEWLSTFPRWIEHSFYYNVRLVRPHGLTPDHLRHLWINELCEGERGVLGKIASKNSFEAASVLAAGTETFGIHPSFSDERRIARVCCMARSSAGSTLMSYLASGGGGAIPYLAGGIGACLPMLASHINGGHDVVTIAASSCVAVALALMVGTSGNSGLQKTAAFSVAKAWSFGSELLASWKSAESSIIDSGLDPSSFSPCEKGFAVAARNPEFVRRIIPAPAREHISSICQVISEQACRMRDESLSPLFLRAVFDQIGLSPDVPRDLPSRSAPSV